MKHPGQQETQIGSLDEKVKNNNNNKEAKSVK